MKLLQKYALLKMRIKDIEDELKELEKQIVPVVAKTEDKKIVETYGTFYITDHVTYEFSERLQLKEDDLKKRKEIEKISGIAVKKLKPKFVFTPARIGVPVAAYKFNFNKKS